MRHMARLKGKGNVQESSGDRSMRLPKIGGMEGNRIDINEGIPRDEMVKVERNGRGRRSRGL